MDVVLDREELYREVWSTTVSAIARKYGLTDYDIRKACFALDVPIPIQGYWAKVRAGNPPPTPSLPRKRGESTFTCKKVPGASRGSTEIGKPKSKSKSSDVQSSLKTPATSKESLVDRVMKNTAEFNAKGLTRALAPPRDSMHLLPEDTIGLPRYIPLAIWAQLLLGEHAPHRNTLIRWVHDGFIQPQPIKIGKLWCVRKDAAYVPD